MRFAQVDHHGENMKALLVILAFTASTAFGESQPAVSAPQDKPGSLTREQVAAFENAIAPYVAKARETYPEAKRRFSTGLPDKQTFLLVTRLYDKDGKWEQAFIAIKRIKEGKVTGTISNDLTGLKGFKRGQKYTFPESDILDWVIAGPDGTEEGNFVGKFLDTYKP